MAVDYTTRDGIAVITLNNPPVNGLAPPTQQDLLNHALDNAWPAQRFEQALGQFNAFDRG